MSGKSLPTTRLDDAVLRRVVEVAADAVICVDEARRVIFFNSGAESMFGYTQGEALGMPLTTLIPERFRKTHDKHVNGFAGGPDAARRMGERSEILALRKDGVEFPAEASIASLTTAGGRVFAVVLRDVTERRRFETENSELVRDLRAAVTARDDMLSIVSHDLRNPVNAVKMLAAAIVREGERVALPDPVTGHADVMLQAARQMDALIQDLLDVSRLESGRLSFTPHPCELTELFGQVTDMLAPAAAEAGVAVDVRVKDLPTVDVDPDRLVQVLSNLVGNALKFTGRGGSVTVTGVVEADVVTLTVADTGIGIPAHELPRVFDRFWQSKRTNRSGAGLGLAIARGVIRAHGGRIWIESEMGRGTKVHFTVPRAATPGGAKARG